MNAKAINIAFSVVFLLCTILSYPASAQIEETITVNDGELDIPVMRYEAFSEDAPILIWLPSSRGTSPKQAITASALSDIDIETWVVDLHLAYFIDPGRQSVEQFNEEDIEELILIASQRTTKKVYVLATGQLATLTLRVIANIQQLMGNQNSPLHVGGVVLFHPFLTLPTTTPGVKAEYAPIAQNSTIPIYFVQPSISTRQWHSKKAVKVLQSGGSQVFFHPMPGVSSGYHLRADDNLSDKDLEQRARLAQDLKSAIQLLAIQAPPPVPDKIQHITQKVSPNRYGLKTLESRSAKLLTLNDIYGQPTSINYTDHPLNLVSFWASWCSPCIKELPALRRLYEDYHTHGLRIITINIGETREQMKSILDQYKMGDYTNLSDLSGKTMTTWNVYGFPSNFLIDQHGKMVQGSFGAVEWDALEIRQIINPLLGLPQN